MVPCLSKLIPGQRYLFHEKCWEEETVKFFRARFLEVSDNRLLVDYYEDNRRKLTKGKWSIPTGWIVKVETLDTILHDIETVLPSDVLLEIDNYL